MFFSVKPRSSLPSLSQVNNHATIVFDANTPIETAEWSNTLDRTKPASHVASLLSSQCGNNIALTWSGSDAESGVLDYTIFLSDNGGPYVLWLAHTTQTSGVFSGTFGHSYAFYSVARDRVGNIEDAPSAADAVTTIADSIPPTLACPGPLSLRATSSGGAVVTYSVSAADSCGVPSVSCSTPSGALFPLGTTSVSCTAVDLGSNSAVCSFPVTVTEPRRLTALDPAKVWIGLTNSDDVGIKFDVRAEAYADAMLVGSGALNSVAGGSSGFNNAKLDTIPLTLTGPVDFPAGTTLSMKLYVRNACSGSGKNSGRARLWYGDAAANSRLGTTISNPATFYLLDEFALRTSPGSGPKKTIDVAAGAKCSPFKLFGTWAVAVP